MLLLLLLLRFRCATLLASFPCGLFSPFFVATLEIDDRSTSREGFWIYFAYCLFHSLHSTLEQTPHYLGPPRPRTQTRTHTHTREGTKISRKRNLNLVARTSTHTLLLRYRQMKRCRCCTFFYTACCGNRILPWPVSSHLRGRTHCSCDPQRNICTIFVRIFSLI